jgi:hypothetical protein
MSDLYGDDILLWSEQQADALRRRAANEIDWDNVAEEIESLGRSEVRAVESLLVQALRHILKAEAWPLSRDAPGWRADAIDFRQHGGPRLACGSRGRRTFRENEQDHSAPVVPPSVPPASAEEEAVTRFCHASREARLAARGSAFLGCRLRQAVQRHG